MNSAFGKLTQKPLPAPILQGAFSRLQPSLDPVSSALNTAAHHAKDVGFIPSADLSGFVDLSALDEARRGGGAPASK
ncbi:MULTISPECIES: hypothetical protein [Myxococcus]|uniref:hypothetical protein n=1 Tax=Myxococcus TaxID=32 RepID=UPI001F078F1D|nr:MULTISPECIES: hypothetical protein [Myxococcus]